MFLNTKTTNDPRPATALRRLFERPGIVRAIGAHDALGARLGERAGFDAVWSSGLEISASHGLPDADLLTMNELLTAARWMAGAVAIPVIADCDTGYGNATNVAYTVRRYEEAGIAAISIEDKPFPKLNSFVAGRQSLVPIPEFVGKLAAAKNAKRDPDFMVIGRIEALIAGLGLDEARRRANAYADAGADAILIHAKDRSPQVILDFLVAWQRPTPVVVVPTTYYSVTADELAEAGAKLVIYANHGLRASVAAMTDTLREIYESGGTASVEDRIVPVSTILDLQGVADLKTHDDTYVHAGAVTHATLPPTMDDDLRERQCEFLRRAGVTTTDPAALPDTDTIQIYSADRLFTHQFIARLLASDHDIVLAVRAYVGAALPDRAAIPVRLSRARPDTDLADAERVVEIGGPGGDGEFIGVAKFSPRGLRQFQDAMNRLDQPDPVAAIALLLAQGHPVHHVDCAAGWIRVGATDDLDVVSA